MEKVKTKLRRNSFFKLLLMTSISILFLLIIYVGAYSMLVKAFSFSGGVKIPWVYPWKTPKNVSYYGDPAPYLIEELQMRELSERLETWPQSLFYPMLFIDSKFIRHDMWAGYIRFRNRKMEETWIQTGSARNELKSGSGAD